MGYLPLAIGILLASPGSHHPHWLMLANIVGPSRQQIRDAIGKSYGTLLRMGKSYPSHGESDNGGPWHYSGPPVTEILVPVGHNQAGTQLVGQLSRSLHCWAQMNESSKPLDSFAWYDGETWFDEMIGTVFHVGDKVENRLMHGEPGQIVHLGSGQHGLYELIGRRGFIRRSRDQAKHLTETDEVIVELKAWPAGGAPTITWWRHGKRIPKPF